MSVTAEARSRTRDRGPGRRRPRPAQRGGGVAGAGGRKGKRPCGQGCSDLGQRGSFDRWVDGTRAAERSLSGKACRPDTVGRRPRAGSPRGGTRRTRAGSSDNPSAQVEITRRARGATSLLGGPYRAAGPRVCVPYGVGKDDDMFDVQTIETAGLGDRSYLVDDGEVAVVIDPQRDIDRVLDLVARRGVRVTHVVETHVHNDYVTGGPELARRTGAAYVLPSGSDVEFDARRGLRRRRARGRADAADGAAHAGAHPPPRQLRTRRPRRRRPGRVHRRVHALRRHGPHRPGESRGHRRADPRPVPLGAAAGP